MDIREILMAIGSILVICFGVASFIWFFYMILRLFFWEFIEPIVDGIKNNKEKRKNNLIQSIKQFQTEYPNGFKELFGSINLSNKSLRELKSIQVSCVAAENNLKHIEGVKRVEDLHKTIDEGSQRGFERLSELINKKPFSEYLFYDGWINKQTSFIDTIQNRCDTELDWGYSSYDIPIDNIGDYPVEFPVLHIFRGGVCKDSSLDYSLVQGQICQLGDFVLMPPGVIEAVASFINSTPNAIVLTELNGYGDDWGFIYAVVTHLEETPVSSLSNYSDLEHPDSENIIILQSVASGSEVINNSKLVFSTHRDNRPTITYISFLKEFTAQETQVIIQEEAQRRQDEAERIEREQEASRLYTISHTEKDNWTEFRDHLRRYGVLHLYHFTDRANIQSIKESGGLYSWKYCQEHGIVIPRSGGGDVSRNLDVWHGLEDYVRLSFCKDHPMAYRLKQQGYHLVLLKINIRVAWLQTTLFSDMNATDNEHHHGGSIDDLKRVDIRATQETYVSKESPIFKKHQAEVLVKTFIPLEYIENINDDYIEIVI